MMYTNLCCMIDIKRMPFNYALQIMLYNYDGYNLCYTIIQQ